MDVLKGLLTSAMFAGYSLFLFWRARIERREAGDAKKATLWDNYKVFVRESSGYFGMFIALGILAVELYRLIHRA